MREFFDSFPLWLSLPVAALLGFGLGIVYFRMIGTGVRLMIERDRPWLAIGAGVGRLALLAGVLLLASLCGFLALGAVFGGLLVGRFITVRRMKGEEAWNRH
ncbi:MAG: ATP synthase subunit I [Hyphomicrobiaceae bacterium]|nr:ATP synthase subunit I [Hyphomicrobiaceae bacterium]